MIRRLRVPVIALLVAALVAGACSSSGGGGETLVLAGVEYTEAEFVYGLDVEPDPSVEFAPDVVVVPNGSRAVRGVTGDGLTWTLDPDARGIGDLEVGTVMFLTARGVGRVVAIEDAPDSSDILVTIAPVDLTEVIWNGDFGGDDQVLDVSQMINYNTGEQPWTLSELPPSETVEEAPGEDEVGGTSTGAPRAPGPRRSVPMVDLDEETREPSGGSGPIGEPEPGDGPGSSGGTGSGSGSGSGGSPGAGAPGPGGGPGGPGTPPDLERHERIAPPRPDWGGATTANVSGYRLTPLCCSGGVGVRAVYDDGGVSLSATMRLLASQPTVTWRISIRNGRIQEASFNVSGGGGVSYDVTAGSAVGTARNLHHRITLPGTLSIPAVAAGIPFHLTVRQELLVRTAFSAKDSTLSAQGVWSIDGALGFGYRDGSFGLLQPSAPQVRRSLLDSIRGVSVGVNGLVLGHRLEIKAAIGWDVFSVGPYTELITSIGIVRGSDLASPLVVCRQANLNMWVGAGIGYRIPQIVADVANFFLRIVGARTITSEGSLVGTRVHLVQRSAFAPDSRACDSNAA